MSLIPDAKVEEVRAATDIVDLISRYIPLKRSGSTYKAPCPFHQEKTPSFHVWPETQTFKCFGCGKGGSVFHFLMEREALAFPEAVRQLAQEAGIELGPETGGRGPDRGERERQYEVMEWACRYFQASLRRPEGAKAVEYCKQRQISGETAQRFRVGFAPPGWSGLLEAARAKGIEIRLLLDLGLVREGQRDPYDWFRDRLIFPIMDVRGRVVGFGGRAFGDDEPKYLNSPDTPLFKKGGMLYALDLAREEALKDRRLAVMEGYTDVLMAHQHGVLHAVAGLGTGFTRDHARLVKRYADRVDLIYDGDSAGMRAAERAVGVFFEVDTDVRVVQLPPGQDPCDFLLARGRDAFLARMEEGREVLEFLLERAGSRHDLATLNGRIAAVDDVLGSVARTKNEVKREMLLRRVAETFSVSEAALKDRLRVLAPRGGVLETGPRPAEELADSPTERLLVEALVFRPELASRLTEEWPPERFVHPVYRAIAAEVVGAVEAGGKLDPGRLAGRLTDPEQGGALAALLAAGEGKTDFERQFTDCLSRLVREARLRELRDGVARAQERGDDEEREHLERELFRLRSEKG